MPTVRELNDHGAQDVDLTFQGKPIRARLRRWPLAGPELAARERLATTLDNLPLARALGVPEAERVAALRHDGEVYVGNIPYADRRDAIARVLSWIVSWSAASDDGESLPLDLDALDRSELPTQAFADLLLQIDSRPLP